MDPLGIITNRDVTNWLCCSLLGWYDLLLTRCLHVPPLTIALHVVKVYVMCVCRGNTWAVKSSKERGQEEEGRAKRL